MALKNLSIKPKPRDDSSSGHTYQASRGWWAPEPSKPTPGKPKK